MTLNRYPKSQLRESTNKFELNSGTAFCPKLKYLSQTLIQHLWQQNCFGTVEDKTIEREEDVRRYVGGMTLLTDLCPAMRTDPLALIRGVSEFVTVIYDPAVTFLFPDEKVEAYRISVVHLNPIQKGTGVHSIVANGMYSVKR